jgi:hypothetical protein
MKLSTDKQRQATRARVKRCRAKKAAAGRARVEIYMDQRILDAVERYAAVVELPRALTLRKLVLMGLYIERRLPAPELFITKVRKRFR